MSDQSILRKGNGSMNILREKATLAYVNKNYNESILHWKEIEINGQLSAADCFYLGISHLLNSPALPSKTITYLNKARDLNPSSFSEEINWTLSLAYLKNNQLDKAKSELLKIVDQKAYKSNTAEKLLDSLKKIDQD